MMNVAKPFCPFKIPTDIYLAIKDLRTHSASYWERKGEKMVFDLFRWTSYTVPAYRAFLKKHNINARKILTLKDFKTLPFTSKETYLRRAKYLDLFPYRDIASASTISATSGSTGEPFYFPRNGAHDDMYQYEAEIFLREQFEIDKKSTLTVLGFGLGIWIGGIFTYKVLERLSQKGYKLTIVPTGTNKEQFLNAIKKFAPFYDQIILAGYPPFIKDVLDEGADYGIRWRNYKIKILTAAEGYSEKFREYIAEKAGVKNMFCDIVNIYGTVELGTMSHETALGNLIRHLAVKNKKLFKALFPETTNIPTLCQYYPYLHYFEDAEVEGRREIIASSYGTHTPLIRYRFHDLGGVIPFGAMMEKLSACDVDIKKEMRRYGLDMHFIKKLPFVYVWARSDFSVSLYGIVIYPEYLREALPNRDLSKFITDRFSLSTRYNRAQNQFLEINIELRKTGKPNKKIIKKIKECAIEALLKQSTEYNHLYHSSPTYAHRLIPKVILWSYHHPKYFSRTGKQAWIKK